MDALVSRNGSVVAPGATSLSTLQPRTVAVVRGVGLGSRDTSALERRLIELGFVKGERVEVLTESRPGGDPFVIHVGDTTFAMRRGEVETVWVDITPSDSR